MVNFGGLMASALFRPDAAKVVFEKLPDGKIRVNHWGWENHRTIVDGGSRLFWSLPHVLDFGRSAPFKADHTVANLRRPPPPAPASGEAHGLGTNLRPGELSL
jgi:hypothetical protein